MNAILIDAKNSSFNSTYFGIAFNYNFISKSDDNRSVKKTLDKKINRLITYFRNEIVMVKNEDISHIFIEHGVTYVVDNKGNKTISNKSLEVLYSSLASEKFFKVNRQHIVALQGVRKIFKSGNALKLELLFNHSKPILVGKNKVAAFKSWLNNTRIIEA